MRHRHYLLRRHSILRSQFHQKKNEKKNLRKYPCEYQMAGSTLSNVRVNKQTIFFFNV